ncbi:MAG: hypothetical protein HRU80_03830 [Ignavibacteriales bacterium]|nr:MAG: hypothetical protein HRU80_03830 [Ignavibacteriales bacterium]
MADFPPLILTFFTLFKGCYVQFILKTFCGYMTNTDFRVWQNALAQECSEFLKTAYTAKMGEVKMVTEMAGLLSNKYYKNIRLSEKKFKVKLHPCKIII